jgi:hypothetical protein
MPVFVPQLCGSTINCRYALSAHTRMKTVFIAYIAKSIVRPDGGIGKTSRFFYAPFLFIVHSDSDQKQYTSPPAHKNTLKMQIQCNYNTSIIQVTEEPFYCRTKGHDAV